MQPRSLCNPPPNRQILELNDGLNRLNGASGSSSGEAGGGAERNSAKPGLLLTNF